MQADHHEDDADAARKGLVRGILVIVTAVAVGGFVLAQGGFGSSDETVAADVAEESDAADDGEGGEDAEFTSDEIQPATEPTTDTTSANALEPADDDSVGGVSDGGDDDGMVMPSTSIAEAADPADPVDPAGPAQVSAADIAVVVLNAEGTKGIAGEGSEVLRTAGYDVLAPKNADVLASESAILYTGDSDAEARAVAAAFGADDSIVAALDPASPPINDIGAADVVVVIGQDGALGL